MADNKPRLAAFYAGAMAHYIGDLSQFMHLMGKGSRWGSENQKIHSAYEKVADSRIDAVNKTSLVFQVYVSERNFAGTTPKQVAFNVAEFTEVGEIDDMTPGKMYTEWKKLRSQKKGSNPAKWAKRFRDQSGHNINTSIKGVAKLLKLLS